MGLLSDPSLTPRNKLGRNLARHSSKICFFFYVAGLAYFVCLGHSELNHGTYLSENALSPGLVYPEMKQDSGRLAQTLLEELRREQTNHKSDTPHAWIAAKMRQIGLQVHMHNFTLRYPFAGGKEYHGKNIYGILRAPRIGSTEGIVFSAPYRPVTSVHTDISASVPLLLAFADFARKKNYWAKDLIFLVTEQEQLGMHAWLQAYYEGGIHDSDILKCGNLPARAGALQAALNLEIQDFDIDFIDVKIEGLNGQLPNLDMFNLVQRITLREAISSGYKQTTRKRRRRSFHAGIEENLRHMTEMLFSQATGVPTGNHGLFHRYRVESLTLEGVKRAGQNGKYTSALPLLKTVEGISRSLNNLLERFHQSYFFYILLQNDRFVSIGDYMPCLILLAGPLFIRAFLLWLTIVGDDKDDDSEECKDESEQHIDDTVDDDSAAEQEALSSAVEATVSEPLSLPYSAVLLYISAALSLGLAARVLPLIELVRDYLATVGHSIAITASLLLLALVLLGAVMPLLVRLPPAGAALLHIGALIFLGVALIVVGLLNFALGFLLAIVAAPLGILLQPNAGKTFRSRLALFYALLLNPLVLIYLLVLVQTLVQFPELALKELTLRALSATTNAIAFALMDCIIYGNWLYTAITAVFFPLWTLCWSVAIYSCGSDTLTVPLEKTKLKTQ